MSTSIRRNPTEEEKQIIFRRYGGRKCFATGHSIPDSEDVHFDHILALDAGGTNDLSNIAPMCAEHNMQKKTMSLGDFRTKLRIRAFFEQGANQTLNHLLQFCRNNRMIDKFGSAVSVSPSGDNVVIESANVQRIEVPLHKCPITGWGYFYATLPVALIGSDDGTGEGTGLQPRFLIEDKVFNLYQHFQHYPVLQPSIGRVDNGRVKIFDGQHKIAGLLWNERKYFECKVYCEDADTRILNRTNISAHDRYSQTRFSASIMIGKLGKEFAEALDAYRASPGEEKTEDGLLGFIVQRDPGVTKKSDLMKTFRSGLYDFILNHESNGLSALVSKSSRSNAQQPITVDMLQKSLFKDFLFRNTVDEDMNTEGYLREVEMSNLVFFFNLLYEEGLSRYAEADADERRRLSRIMGSKPMIAWSDILKGAICATMELYDQQDRDRPFYRRLSDKDKDKIQRVVHRLLDWAIWNSPEDSEIDRMLNNKQTAVRDWLKEHGLSTGYLLGAEM